MLLQFMLDKSEWQSLSSRLVIHRSVQSQTDEN